MASVPTNVGLRKGVSLISFVRGFSKVDVVPFTDRETGETYHRLVGYDQYDNKTFVNMSSKLDEVKNKSTEEVLNYINSSAKNLQVVETENDTMILCKQGGELHGGLTLNI